MKKNIRSTQNVTADYRDQDFYIGKQIREQREQLQMTREQLAEKIYCSPAHIKKLETNERLPSLETLRMFKNFFNVSYDYLIKGEKEKSAFQSLVENFSAMHKSDQAKFLKYAIDQIAGIESD